MKITHVVKEFFSVGSGAEIYVYELARQQVKSGNDVTIVAPILGGEIRRKAEAVGVRCVTPQGAFGSSDIFHVHHPGVLSDSILSAAPVVATLHDLRDSHERRGRVKAWIVVREDQRQEGDVFIPNPIDTERFKPMSEIQRVVPVVLCCGNFRDDRRKAMLDDLCSQAKTGQAVIMFVGNGLRHLHEHGVRVYPPTWETEKFLKACNLTASLYVGRTVIEGWLCGRGGWVYQPDGTKVLMAPPTDAAFRFSAASVAEQVEEIYRRAI